jgi:hypothetical protein
MFEILAGSGRHMTWVVARMGWVESGDGNSGWTVGNLVSVRKSDDIPLEENRRAESETSQIGRGDRPSPRMQTARAAPRRVVQRPG